MIEEHFPSFLAQTNFGTRQSKGFGSFFVEKKPFELTLVDGKTVYHFSSTVERYEEDIALLYAFLRSGLNYPNRDGETRFYMKPAIFVYAKHLGITWDKKAIKQHYFSNEVEHQNSRHPHSDALLYEGEERRLMRDLLGLSTSQEWRSYRATITKSHPSIGRFRSPIFFKPIRGENEEMEIYFWAESGVEPILSQSFHIKCNDQGNMRLSTPETFDVNAFLQFAFDIPIERHVESQFHELNEYKYLQTILSQINQSRSAL